MGEEFQCDGAIELDVVGFVHHAHPAFAQLREDLVVGDRLTDEGSHCSSS